MDTITFPRQLARTQRFSLGVPRAFTLLPDGAGALFLRTRGPEDRMSCLWLRDAAGERLLVDPAALPGAAAEVPAAELVRRERARERSVGIVAYSTDAAVRTVAFALDGALWVLGPDRDPAAAAGGPWAASRRLATAGPV
ncbi:dipeptidyl-peptidase-4, partial [Streptomyces sp. DvalAA-14]